MTNRPTSPLQALATGARIASRRLGLLGSRQKNQGLALISLALRDNAPRILAANLEECDEARAGGMSAALLDRLMLNEPRIETMAAAIEALIKLDDPIGEQLESWSRPSGITIVKRRVPLGVVAIVYEARPNVTVDAAGLTLKTGNSVILRGSSNALRSNRVLVEVMRAALEAAEIPSDAVTLIDDTTRASVEELLQLKGMIDVVIPRGGKELIDFVTTHSKVPTIETGAGVCHLYIHGDADRAMAVKIAVNAKAQRPSVCNAIETIIVDREWAERHLAELVRSLEQVKVSCKGCEQSRGIVPHLEAVDHWSVEYMDYVVAIRCVDSLDEAIDHITLNGTMHSESIVTGDRLVAEEFLNRVDAAAVYHNCSTRFTDGFEFGFGAEIGISTQKLHARGPMGLKELTTYKYVVTGDGAVRG